MSDEYPGIENVSYQVRVLDVMRIVSGVAGCGKVLLQYEVDHPDHEWESVGGWAMTAGAAEALARALFRAADHAQFGAAAALELDRIGSSWTPSVDIDVEEMLRER